MLSKKVIFAASLALGFVASSCASVHSAETVELGKVRLTSGISGKGALSVAEIKKFLADPKNHLELAVTLPEGLAAGSSAIYIPEDNPLTRAKFELGRQLYFDKRLSGDGTVSCADCHSPATGYGANTQFGVGIKGQTGNRNSPVSFNRILSKAQFWDGRADSLEAQAIGPMANPIEMGSTHEAVVKLIASNEGYRIQFEKIFGKKPDITLAGKAIAAFERTIVTGPSPYDLYEPVRRLLESFYSSAKNRIALLATSALTLLTNSTTIWVLAWKLLNPTWVDTVKRSKKKTRVLSRRLLFETSRRRLPTCMMEAKRLWRMWWSGTPKAGIPILT